MNHVARAAGLVWAAVLLVLAGAGAARAGLRITQEQLRIDGRVAAPSDDASGTNVLDFQSDERHLRLVVDEIMVIQGNRLGADVLAELEPYQGKLVVAGDKSTLRDLFSRSPGDRIRVYGYRRRGSRTMLIGRVEPPPTKPER